MSHFPLPSWMHPSRWENYALLAFASLCFLALVLLRGGNAGAPAREILALATRPLPERSRDSEPLWLARHKAIVERAASGSYDVVLLGDSITQGWELNQSVWQSHFHGIRALNAGIASDRIEHVLWRVDHGLFDVVQPRVVVLLVGVNNLALNGAGEIAGGVEQVVRRIHLRTPGSRILLLSLFPAGREPGTAKRAKIQQVNAGLATLAQPGRVEVLDLGRTLLDPDGAFTHAVSFDSLHLTRQGYERWAAGMQRKLVAMLGS